MKFSERHRRLVFSLPIRFEVFNASRVFWSFCSRLADFDFSVRAASVPLRAGKRAGLVCFAASGLASKLWM
jgi:hypothetical protein